MELLGIRATIGPLENTTLELKSGLTSLYGINGAGKTSILDALSWAFTGHRERGNPDERVVLYVRMPEEELTGIHDTPSWQRAVLRKRNLTGGSNDVVAFREEAESVLARDLEEWSHLEGLVEELLDSNVVGLRPVGVTEPRWEVWLCGEPEKSPDSVLAGAIASIRSEWPREVEVFDRIFSNDDDEYRLDRWAEESRIDRYSAVFRSLLLDERPEPGDTVDRFVEEAIEENDLESVLLADGLPIPIARLGVVESIAPLRLDSEPTLDEALRRSVSATHGALLNEFDDAKTVGPEQHQFAKAWTEDLAARTTDTYRSLLLDAPRLEPTLTAPLSWLSGANLNWKARTAAAGRFGTGLSRWTNLQRLSSAQQRWAAFALAWEADPSFGTGIVLLDEPEAALHRTAEEQLAEGIGQLAASRGGTWVVATHSPALLDDPQSHVMHVRRDARGTRVDPLTQHDYEDLAVLGLEPSDGLRRWRKVVLVEGEHDQIVLQTILGDQLHRARVHILPIRGGTQLKYVVESPWLWRFSDAQLVPLLDNLDSLRTLDILEQAERELKTLGNERALSELLRRFDELKESRPDKADEVKFIKDFVAEGIKKYDQDFFTRARPWSLSKPDILDYLPIEVFLPEVAGQETWESLREKQKKQNGGKEPGDFKGWLKKVYKREIFSSDKIRQAALQVEDRSEFDRFLEVLQQD